ncbi:peroxidase 41-like [Cornus florida]|uniref:peroxidase 41-like n=1 Tax=Cornus florida TaxID=4283 RepID=UPI00289D7734|nr:peroxidase 41-like [Cornus florida]
MDFPLIFILFLLSLSYVARSQAPVGPQAPAPVLGPQGPVVPGTPAVAPVAPGSPALLSLDYYAKTCPKFEQIVTEQITTKQSTNPSTAAAILRVFFHDCIVDGCDASILVGSTHTNKAERDAEMNESLAGDAFDIVTRIKTALELACPGIVSCADILAMATRNLVKMVGGPFYNVLLGRKDSLVSEASRVEPNLSKANHSMDEMIKRFGGKGFSVEEMVTLVGGGHTIGFAHCKEFSNRIFNFSQTSEVDPGLNRNFADQLRNTCRGYEKNPAMCAFLDPMSPSTFDNNIFKNLLKGGGVLASDHLLFTDPRTKPLVERYAADQHAFFQAFTKAIEKVSLLGVKTGNDGEVRHRCDKFNSK